MKRSVESGVEKGAEMSVERSVNRGVERGGEKGVERSLGRHELRWDRWGKLDNEYFHLLPPPLNDLYQRFLDPKWIKD